MSSDRSRVSVGILGATGTVGQRFIQLLDGHPDFSVSVLGASHRSAGQVYANCVQWQLSTPIPDVVKSMTIQQCDPAFFKSCQIVFSGLDSQVAGEVEAAFRDAGFAVFSNAKNHRMDPRVPLVVPLCNPEHLQVLNKSDKGFIVTNANCSTTGLVVVLKPLRDAFGLKAVQVATLQAISGAGYPGLPSLTILNNVIPYIEGEEEKLQQEPLKILGSLQPQSNQIQSLSPSDLPIDAACHRVPVLDGHTLTVWLRFERPPSDLKAIREVLSEYRTEAQRLGLRSAPLEVIHVEENRDRPQPRLDLEKGAGMTVTVGGLRKCRMWDVCLTLLSHNTVLGAAGSSILNAELCQAVGLF